MFRSFGPIIALMLVVSCVPLSKETGSKLSFRGPSSEEEKMGLLTYSSEIQMAPRSYVESVLMQVFDASGTTAATYIQSDIYQRVEFGGACDLYAASYTGSTFEFVRDRCINSIGVVQKSTNNPMRYSLTTKVCERLIVDTARMAAVRKKIFSNDIWATPDDQSVAIAWELFFPTTDLSPSVRSALKDIGGVSANPAEAWKGIILTLCISPEWQIF